MEKIIIGISGKRSSGKTETAKYLQQQYNSLTESNGDIVLYNIADMLKRDVCINVLGLTEEMVYGTDEQKAQLTHLKWEDMPGVTATEGFEIWSEHKCAYPQDHNEFKYITGNIVHESGYMTAREVMQYVGTGIFRKMYSDVWIDATLRKINNTNHKIYLIGDVRFPNEAGKIRNFGGYLWRYTRITFDDQHESETALDSWGDWDLYLDNQNMSLDSQKRWCLEELELILNGKQPNRV